MSKTEKRKGSPLLWITLLGKSGKLLKFMKLAKLFKVAKPLVLLVSMSVSAVAYAFMLGPWLSVIFVLLLFIHEMGHVVAMKMKGFETPTPVFIPFLGAVIFAPKFKERHSEAFVGFGGPFLGTLGALAVFGIWAIFPKDTEVSHILLVGSYLGTYLNLFNMLPISPLDGGRITQAVGSWFRYIGLAGLVLFSIWFRQPVVLYIWIIVLVDLTIIPLTLRAGVTTSCWIAMATLMYLGYGDQPFWVNVLDCIITLPLVGMLCFMAFFKTEMEESENRQELSREQKMFWLGSYLVLCIVLGLMIFLQFPYLPKKL